MVKKNIFQKLGLCLYRVYKVLRFWGDFRGDTPLFKVVIFCL